MIVNIYLSHEIFAIDVLRPLKSSLKHRRKHVLRPSQLYGDQALISYAQLLPKSLIRKLSLVFNIIIQKNRMIQIAWCELAFRNAILRDGSHDPIS